MAHLNVIKMKTLNRILVHDKVEVMDASEMKQVLGGSGSSGLLTCDCVCTQPKSGQLDNQGKIPPAEYKTAVLAKDVIDAAIKVSSGYCVVYDSINCSNCRTN